MSNKCVLFDEPLEESIIIRSSSYGKLNGVYTVIGKNHESPKDINKLPRTVVESLGLKFADMYFNLDEKIEEIEYMLKFSRSSNDSSMRKELSKLKEKQRSLKDDYRSTLVKDNKLIYNTRLIFYCESNNCYLVRRSLKTWNVFDNRGNVIAECDGRGNWCYYKINHTKVNALVFLKGIVGGKTGTCKAYRKLNESVDLVAYNCVELKGFDLKELNGVYKTNELSRRIDFESPKYDEYTKGDLKIKLYNINKNYMFWVIFKGNVFTSLNSSNTLAYFQIKNFSTECKIQKNSEKRSMAPYQRVINTLYCTIQNNPDMKWTVKEYEKHPDNTIVVTDSKMAKSSRSSSRASSKSGRNSRNRPRRRTIKRPPPLKYPKGINSVLSRRFDNRTLKEYAKILSPIREVSTPRSSSPRRSSPRRSRSGPRRSRSRTISGSRTR